MGELWPLFLFQPVIRRDSNEQLVLRQPRWPLRKAKSTWKKLRLTVENAHLACRHAPSTGATPD